MSTDTERRSVTRPDGRVIEFLVAGPADGLPLVLHEGTPSGLVLYPPTVRAAARHGLRVLIPPEPDLTLVHDVIYAELCRGRVLDRSRDEYRRIIAGLEAAGAGGIIYGCTEIDLLVGPDDAAVPVFDSTRIHVDDAVEWALAPAHAATPAHAPTTPAAGNDRPQSPA